MTASSVDVAARWIVELLDQNDLRRAIQEAEQAVRRTPGSSQLWTLLGAARLLAEDFVG